jgi:hypothetical protein
MVETGANTGHFVNWDDALKTSLLINTDAARGSTSTINYDGDNYSILHMPSFGSVEFDTSGIGADWNSGEIVNVNIIDEDQNYDVRQEDALKTTSNTTIVPAIKIGSPITMANVDAIYVGDGIVWDRSMDVLCSSDYVINQSGAVAVNSSYTSCYEKYSERVIATAEMTVANADGGNWNIRWNDKVTVQDALDTLSTGNGSGSYSYVQYDFRSINGGSDDGNVHLQFAIGDRTVGSQAVAMDTGTRLHAFSNVASGNGLVGIALLASPGDTIDRNSTDASDNLSVNVNYSTSGTAHALTAGTSYPLSMDIVTFGQSNDGVIAGDRANNAIYRIEAEEIAADGELCCNTGIFTAEIEYIMLNQINVNSSGTYNGTTATSDEIVMIIHNDMTDEDEIRVNYFDFGADGVETQVADQLAAPTHSGVVEFDSDSYKEADTVTVTLTDADINIDPLVIDIYTVVTASNDGAYDMVGAAGYGQNSMGENFGRMLDITFDDGAWVDDDEGTACTTGGPANDGEPTKQWFKLFWIYFS